MLKNFQHKTIQVTHEHCILLKMEQEKKKKRKKNPLMMHKTKVHKFFKKPWKNFL